MKYYAVTEDPRELYHYGVKGMKWGQHLFGDKPKSPGYHKAVSKLKGIMGKTAKAAKSTASQMAYNHRQRQDRKFEKAVQKSQKRIAQIEGLHLIDQAQNYDLSLSKDNGRMAKQQSLAYKAERRREMNYAKNEAKMDKYVQQARQGKLKYGKLSPDQIQRVQDRLQLEANTRRLGSAEKTWGQQKKEARRKGKLQGIERGTAAVMEEVARAGAQAGIAGIRNRMLLNNKAKQEGKRERIRNAEKNKKTHKELKDEVKDKIYKERYEIDRRINSKEGKELTRLTEQKKLDENNNEQIREMLIEGGYNNINDAIKEQKRLMKDGYGKDDSGYKAFAKAKPEEQRDMMLSVYNRNKKAKEQLEKDKKEKDAREKERAELANKALKLYATNAAYEKYQNGEDLSYPDVMLLKEAGIINFKNNGYKGQNKK